MGKNLYITTAIPYANAKPHIGNALDYLIADIWSRYQKQNGRTVRFQVGTDEHGNKIAAKAAELKIANVPFADGKGTLNAMHQVIKNLDNWAAGKCVGKACCSNYCATPSVVKED